jgi:hypothetical protein
MMTISGLIGTPDARSAIVLGTMTMPLAPG